MAYKAKSYTMRSVVPLPRRKVWELLSDTDHLNRFIGLFALEASPVRRGTDGFFREIAAKVGGVVPVRWKEYPFEWAKESYYAVRREYESGPLRLFYGGVRLRDAAPPGRGEESTEIELFAEFTPANPLAFAAIPLTGYRALVRTLEYVNEYVRLNAGRTETEKLPQGRSRPLNSAPLDRWRAGLPGDQRRLGGKLCGHLAWSDDDGVVDMRPYVLARKWNEDREETLRLFLQATRAGLLNLSWNLICPNCRVSKEQMSTLSRLEPQFHCDFCGIAYEASFDRHVELRFTVHRSVREAQKQVYCIGGPMITPHIAAQTAIRPGQEAVIDVPERLWGRLRLRTLQSNRTLEEPSAGSAYVYDGEGWSEERRVGTDCEDSGGVREGGHGDKGGNGGEIANIKKRAISADGTKGGNVISVGISENCGNGKYGQITLRNGHKEPIVAVLETADADGEAVTAAKVTTMHEFRMWFSSEVLAPGQQVGVESVTLLFSDLLGSTAFYEQVGDAPAYGQVRRHFDFMLEWVRANRGTLVKTIGDAVMAVFPEPRFGMQAALDIQRRVGAFNRERAADTPIVIKIGLHHGPAIAVNSNGLLDYFGRTVNIAARIQAQSEGGDIVVSEAIAADPHVQPLLGGRGVTERFSSRLKGIGDNIELLRIRPHNGASGVE